MLFGLVYVAVGVAFPNPPASNEYQFVWRFAAWVICAGAFAMHVAIEQTRFRSTPRSTAVHAALSVALGALGLAAAANVHALSAGTGNRRLLALALVIWPVMIGIPAFLAAWVAAAGLARWRR